LLWIERRGTGNMGFNWPRYQYVIKHTHACTHTYIHTYMCTCIHTYMCTCIHTYIHTYAHIHASMHAYIHTLRFKHRKP
jgi:hypothetical protein